MPLNSTLQRAVLNPDIPYDRLALRCALTVALDQDRLVHGGTMALQATRYRKPAAGEFEILGLVGHGEIGASIHVGDSAEGDDMLLAVANIARENANVSGDCTVALHFSWRPEAGDLIGMASETVTPVNGEPVSDSCPNVGERASRDPVFAAHYSGILRAIGAWVTAKGW